jgi:glutaredoxin
MKTVTVYTRSKCGLCRAAVDAIERVRVAHPFELRELDVDRDLAPGDPRHGAYGVAIPVVEIDGELVFRTEVDVAAFTRMVVQATEP